MSKKKYAPLFVSFRAYKDGVWGYGDYVGDHNKPFNLRALNILKREICEENNISKVTILNWKRMEA